MTDRSAAGTADVQRTGQRIATMRGGDFFGEIALATDLVHSL